MLSVECGSRAYKKITLKAVTQKEPFSIKIHGWRLKMVRKIVSRFFEYFYGRVKNPGKEKRKDEWSYLRAMFLVWMSPMGHILLFADRDGYEIKWDDQGDEGILTANPPGL